MREILFRGKITQDEWVYGFYENVKLEEATIHYVNGKIVIPKTVGQYTGLTDKNGKKIFEGDIVEFTNKFTHKKGHAEIVFEAFKWKYSGCYYGGNPIVWLCIDDTSVEYEVIGNIHDNPELLEVKNELHNKNTLPEWV